MAESKTFCQQILDDRVELEVLVEEGEGFWAHDYTPPEVVPLDSVIRIVPADYGQRQDQGPSNPHGEHAHEVWLPLQQLLNPSLYRGPQ